MVSASKGLLPICALVILSAACSGVQQQWDALGKSPTEDGGAVPLYDTFSRSGGRTLNAAMHLCKGGTTDPDLLAVFCEPDFENNHQETALSRRLAIHAGKWDVSMFALPKGMDLTDDTDRLDLEGKLTNGGRLSFVRGITGQCIPEGRPSGGDSNHAAFPAPGSQNCDRFPVDPAYLPVAAAELAKIDWDALIHDVQAKAPEDLKDVAAWQVRAIRAHLTKELSGVKPEDVAAAKKRYDEWMALRDANKAMIDDALSVVWKTADTYAKGGEEARDPAPPCPEKLQSSMEAILQSRAPKNRAEAFALMDDPMIYVAIDALHDCVQKAGPKAGPFFFTYAELVNDGRLWRGPRRYAELQAKASPPPVAKRRDRYVIKKVEKKNGAVLLSFKSETWLEQGWSCHDTRRIESVYWDGVSARINYEQECTSIGMVRKEQTYEPVWVHASFADVLKPGQEVSFGGGGTADDMPGVILELYPDRKASEQDGKLLVFANVILK